MTFYLLTVFSVVAALVIIYGYWKEIQYRKKPFYALSEIGWRHCHLPAASEKVSSVILLGDFGNVETSEPDAVLISLEKWMAENPVPERTLILLGDNIYPIGLPAEDHVRREEAETKLRTQLEAFKKWPLRTIYLSGNHDWNKGRKNGYEYMKRQEKYVLDFLEDPESYLPLNGCPGPVTRQLADNVLLVVINTQWWVQKGIKPIGKEFNCQAENEDHFFRQLNQVLKENRHQRILIAAHHPLYSNAIHGGKFTLKHHIFPLTAAHKKFYIPLPFFGSIYPVYRKYIGAAEDMSHPRYKRLRKRLLNIIRKYPNIVYAAGHDHNLQYFHHRGGHYLVSGSGSKTTFVKKGGKAMFTHEAKGFIVLDYYRNGDVWLSVEECSGTGDDIKPETFFRKNLYNLPASAADVAVKA